MKSICVIPKKKNSVYLKEVPEPVISGDEILIRTIETGVDGTDLEINDGLYGESPKNSNFLILGHESFGEVVKTGSSVKNLKKGDYVVPTVRRPCRACVNCKKCESDMCCTGEFLERGIKGLHGYMSGYFKEKPHFLVHVPKKFKDFAVLTEPMSICEKAVEQIFLVQRRMEWNPKTALVLGAGTIGILSAMLLRLKNIEVFMYARKPYKGFRKKVCDRLKVKYISAQKYNIEEIKKNYGQFDIIIEAAGYSPLSFHAIDLIAVNGVLCLTGITGGNEKTCIPSDKFNLDIVLGNKMIIGVVNSNAGHFKTAIKDFFKFERKWKGLLSSMITRREGHNNFKKAFVRNKNDVKVAIRF